jgi:hypothetical protein
MNRIQFKEHPRRYSNRNTATQSELVKWHGERYKKNRELAFKSLDKAMHTALGSLKIGTYLDLASRYARVAAHLYESMKFDAEPSSSKIMLVRNGRVCHVFFKKIPTGRYEK